MSRARQSHLAGVESQKGVEAGQAPHAGSEDEPWNDRGPVQNAHPASGVRAGDEGLLAEGAKGGHHGGGRSQSPHGREPGHREDVLSEDRSQGHPSIDADRQEAHGLASTRGRSQIAGGGHGRHQEARLPDAGHQPQPDEDIDRVGAPIGRHRGTAMVAPASMSGRRPMRSASRPAQGRRTRAEA